MVNVNKLKSMKKTLGSAPTMDEASNNINSPEVAPIHQINADNIIFSQPLEEKHIDGRALRRTNRSHRLTLAVSPEFNATLREMAVKKNVVMVKILEEALELYKKNFKY